ncbi:MAG: hypothetical protein K2X48_15690 [Chitinophagaceae bacterium]|nr:hypothetical protein [Chitinophagaceae bacterium]
MKNIYCKTILLAIVASASLFAGAQTNFDIIVSNNTFFNITTMGYPVKGQGIFYPFNSLVEKDKNRYYKCKQDAILKGVEGHLKFKASGDEVPGMIDMYSPEIG